MRDVAGDDNVIRFLDDLSFRMALAVRNPFCAGYKSRFLARPRRAGAPASGSE